MDLNGSVAIVTGAAGGIGRAVVAKLGAYGARLSLIDVNVQGLELAARELKDAGRDCLVLQADVTDYEQVKSAVKRTAEQMGEPDILVNTVGWDIIEPFVANTPEYWEKVIALNYKSVVYCCRAVLDYMIARQKGKIVNIGSDAGRVGSLGETVYAGAKGGVIAFTKSLAREVARYSICVNCVCPGPTDTPLYRSQPEKNRLALERVIPFRRVATPEDVAGAVLFFASGLSDYITGQVLSVSGGLTMVG